MTRDEAVVEYISYVKTRCKKWTRMFPSKKEDILATALLALVKAFDAKIPETDIERRKWLSTCIFNAISDFLVYDKLMPIPKNELKRLKELEQQPEAILLENQIASPDSPAFIEQLKRCRAKHQDNLAFEELIDRLQLSHRDLQILHRIMEGYTQQETAKLVKVSQYTVSTTLSKIAERYNATS